MKAKTVKGVQWVILCIGLGIICTVILLCGSCKGNIGTGYRTLLVLRDVGNVASKAIGDAAQAKSMECAKNMDTYKACIADTAKLLEVWINTVKPALKSAMEATWGVLESARKAKEKDASWLAKLKPGVCGFLKAFLQWQSLIGDSKAQAIIAPIKLVKGMVCP